MTLNKSREQLPSTWDKNGLGSDGKRCLEVTGLKIKYVGQYSLTLNNILSLALSLSRL